MASLQERLSAARQALVGAGVEAAEAALDAELLARDVLGWDRAALLTRRHDPVPPDFDRRYQARLARRARREPVAYILGHQEFWGLDFEVTHDVLIPRPETELIVEEAIRSGSEHGPYGHIIDVGTGSGCLAVTLAVEFPSALVVATDLSAPALEIARRNAARHGVAGRVTFLTADLLDGVNVAADLIVSNPPYVPATDRAGLPPEVGQYEPAAALIGGDDGLSVIRRLFASAPRRLARNGSLIVEFGFGQEAQVRAIAETLGWSVDVRHDLQSIPRVAVLRR
jgi:release factor glutamine methyltransferase